MGMWGYEAWDNDGAADWFCNLMDNTDFRKHWLPAISHTDEDAFEEIRAAIWVFVQLGRTYIWPIDHIDDDLELAIKACDLVLNNEDLIDEVPDYLEKVKQDRETLIARRQPSE